MQEILTFQTHTIRMMYKLIGDALKAHGSPNHPRDYLNFFCLGNRETKCALALHALRGFPLYDGHAFRILKGNVPLASCKDRWQNPLESG